MSRQFYRLTFMSPRLQICIFDCDIGDARARLLRVQVVMTDNQRAGVSLVQLLQQMAQGCLLGCGTRVGGSAADVQPALIADAYGVGVVVLAVGACEPFRSAFLDLSVTTDDVVVAYPEFPAALAVPRIDLGCRTGLVGAHCRTVNHKQGNTSHDCTNTVELMAVRIVMMICTMLFHVSFFIIFHYQLSIIN